MPARIPKAVCIAELRRVAELLGRNAMTAAAFDAHANVSSQAVRVRCGGSWDRALEEAGLSIPRRMGGKPKLLETLARALVQATLELGRVPTQQELARHADCHPATLAKRWGGYPAFKRAALAFLLNRKSPLPVAPEVRRLLEAAQRSLRHGNRHGPHPGRTRRRFRPLGAQRLDFRGFAYAPTCEQGVVQLFGAVAWDLGFEIVHTQSAFPDCLARRNKLTWRIEFEYTSADFRRHHHPPEGCDLIVCWTHDWPGCLVRVLALEDVVKKLPSPSPSTRRTRTYRLARR